MIGSMYLAGCRVTGQRVLEFDDGGLVFNCGKYSRNLLSSVKVMKVREHFGPDIDFLEGRCSPLLGEDSHVSIGSSFISNCSDGESTLKIKIEKLKISIIFQSHLKFIKMKKK